MIDIYEALVAQDRPYKPRTSSEKGTADTQRGRPIEIIWTKCGLILYRKEIYRSPENRAVDEISENITLIDKNTFHVGGLQLTIWSPS